MGWSRKKRDGVRFLFGVRWWAPVAGTVVALLYNFAMYGVGATGLDLGLVGYAGGILGGLVAGALQGTNWTDGAADGFRAGTYGMVATSVLAGLILFVVLYLGTGEAFLLVASVTGLFGAIFLAPAFGFFGALGGIVGVLLRRAVVPDDYNPPARGPV